MPGFCFCSRRAVSLCGHLGHALADLTATGSPRFPWPGIHITIAAFEGTSQMQKSEVEAALAEKLNTMEDAKGKIQP